MDTNKFEIETAEGIKSFDLNCDYDLRYFYQTVKDMGGQIYFSYFGEDAIKIDSEDPIKLLFATWVMIHGGIDDNSFMIGFDIENLKFKIIHSSVSVENDHINYSLIIGENRFSTLDDKGDHSCKKVLYNGIKAIGYKVDKDSGKSSFQLMIDDLYN